MTGRTSPTVRRRRLAAELRRLRAEAGKNRDEAAKYAGIASATMWRLETAQHAPRPADIAMLCRFYGLDDERTDAMVTLARESRLKGWWQQYSDKAIPDWFETYVGLEEEVAEIRTYQPEAIYGLLQSEEYAYAVLNAGEEAPAEEVARRVEVRMKRQELLKEPDMPKLWVILNEAVLRREVGGRAAMREQLLHLLTASRRIGITVQILPLSTGAHPSMDSGFTILGFPERRDPDVVYVQYRRGSFYLEEPAEVDDYTQLFDQLRARALGPDESRSLIKRIADEMA